MYLFEWPDEREHETVRRLFSGPHLIYADFWRDFGVAAPAWFGFRLTKQCLDGGPHNRTDVDVLVGSAISDAEGLWSPSPDGLFALEVKVSWVGQEGTLHSTKERRLRKAYRQAESLLELGVERAALLWIIVTEPVERPHYHPWLAAGSQAWDARHALEQLPGYEKLLSKDSPVGFAVFPWGAVAGGRTEEWSGAGGPEFVRVPRDNPLRDRPDVEKAREHVRLNLVRAFGAARYHNIGRGLVFVRSCAQCEEPFLGEVSAVACGNCVGRNEPSGAGGGARLG